jgi:hypothetical protein
MQFHVIVSLKQTTTEDMVERNARLDTLQEETKLLASTMDQKSTAILNRLHWIDDKLHATFQNLRENHLTPPKSPPQRARQIVLSTLYPPSLSLRMDQVSANHPETRGWIFRRPLNNVENEVRSNFVRWLETGSGCYWISRKAGSGKSILMK